MRWNGIVQYYTWIFFIFLAMLIYSATQASSYGQYDCFGKDVPAATNSTSTNSTLTSSTVISATNSTSTNSSITSIVKIMEILYIIEVVLVALLWLFMLRLSNLEVTKFMKPGFLNRCMGFLSKLIPYAIVLLHYVILVFIVIMFILGFLVQTCYWSRKTNSTGAYDHTVMNDSGLYMVLCALVWFGTHLIGGCYRRNVTYDAYFYTPAVENKCCRWFLINTGP